MGGRATSGILIAGTFLVSVMMGVDVTAQTVSPRSTTGSSQQTHAQNRATVEQHPACQRIINECKNLGFIQGQWKKDNGLWKDCFDPVVKGAGSATRDGKPITVPVSASDVEACRGAEAHHR
jgi:hypothetical protein